MRASVFVVLSLLCLAGCQQTGAVNPLLLPSDAHFEYRFDRFEDYQAATAAELKQHRIFVTDDSAQEIAMNQPFELRPKAAGQPTRGVLLVHGLGDSPWSFVDVGQALMEQGYLVRTVLLEGHGTRPGDMIGADYQHWRDVVAHHTQLLKQEVGKVYLGGFSTGANLAYLQANSDPEIAGLMLFSPAFISDEQFIGLSPLLAWFKPWLYEPSLEGSSNAARYRFVPTNGFAQYYYSSAAAQDAIDDKPFERPVFMALTAHDSVLEATEIRALFERRFTHPDSRLIWFDNRGEIGQGRVRVLDSRVPELKVSNMSHMGMLFSPANPYYGIDGSQRICHNGQTEMDTVACLEGEPVWYGAWGTQVEGVAHARLTFNPYFDTMMAQLNRVFE